MTASRPQLKTVAEALGLIKKYLPDWTGLGNLTVDSIIADRDYPSFHRVMMDGIALSFQTYAQGQRKFQIAGICPAGQPQQKLSNSSDCMEVMTGAPLPEGADLVVPYEHLSVIDGIAEISFEQERRPMDHVHLMGSDFRKGDQLLPAGSPLHGPHQGIAASVGVLNPPLLGRAKILIISTGDELVPVAQQPLPHQMRRSNVYALQTSLQLHGYQNITLSHLKDDENEIAAHYQEHAGQYDLMIYSGGVSMGKFDYLPRVWQKAGVEEHFHGVRQKPGKPLWFGVDAKNRTAVLGLPGNPVSSLICLHRYLLSRKDVYVQLGEDITFKPELTQFTPAKLEFSCNGTLIAHPLKIKNSGEFSALAGSDGFIELPAQQIHFQKGETFLYHPWRPL